MRAVRIATFVAVVVSSFAAHAAAPLHRPGTASERLLELVANGQTATVIVGFRLARPWVPDATLLPEQARAQRDQIRQRKEALLRAHPRARRVAGSDYPSIPFIAITVDEHAMRRLLNDDDVLSIEENLPAVPALGETTVKIGAPTVHARQPGYKGESQVIVVIDSGVEKSHPFLENRIISNAERCYSTTDSTQGLTGLCPSAGSTTSAGSPCSASRHTNCGHGTRVAGVAAGKDPGSRGYSGVAPEAEIVPIQVYSCKAENADACKYLWAMYGNVASALQYVKNDLVPTYGNKIVVNMSLVINMSYAPNAFDKRSGCAPDKTAFCCDNRLPLLVTAVADLTAAGVSVVAGAGNAGKAAAAPGSISYGGFGQIYPPSCLTGVVAVGATDDDDNVASYSNSAGIMDFWAPGGRSETVQPVNTSEYGGAWRDDSGTSLAAPHVTGALALLRQAKPTATTSELYGFLASTGAMVADTRATDPQLHVTKPRINLAAAIEAADPIIGPPTGVTVTPLSSTLLQVSWTAPATGSASGYKVWRRDTAQGAWGTATTVSSTTYTDTVTAARRYEYKVASVSGTTESTTTANGFGMSVVFTDDPVRAANDAGGTLIRGAHIGELRSAVDAWRRFHGVAALFSSYAAPTGNVAAQHFTDLVSGLNGARSAAGLPNFAYSAVAAPATNAIVDRRHVQQLRDTMK